MFSVKSAALVDDECINNASELAVTYVCSLHYPIFALYYATHSFNSGETESFVRESKLWRQIRCFSPSKVNWEATFHICAMNYYS